MNDLQKVVTISTTWKNCEHQFEYLMDCNRGWQQQNLMRRHQTRN